MTRNEAEKFSICSPEPISHSPMKVIPIEQTLPVRRANSPYARKNALRTVRDVVEWVSHHFIADIPKYSRRDLSLKAIDAYEAEHGKPDPVDADNDFYARIEVNFLRHEKSNYDRVMNGLNVRPGAAEGRLQLRYMILIGIAEVYPHLQDECLRKWKEVHKNYIDGLM